MEAKKNNEGEEKKKVLLGGDEEVMLPGFRFHPTDEELVGFYLKRKIQQRPLSIELIKHLDIYKYDPWDLPKFASAGEKEWYFFVPRDRKYRNSTRPNRVTGAGFWKATGTDRPIYSSEGNKCIGLKKSLVFYKGRAAKGVKTDWMMHEFRLPSLSGSIVPSKKCIDRTTIPANDSWAICRIFKKTSPVTPRTASNSWVSPSLPNNNRSIHTLLNRNNYNNNNSNNTPNFSTQIKTTSTSTTTNATSPIQSSFSNISEFNNILQTPNNFSFLDHLIPSFKPIYSNEIENKPCFDQQFLNIPPLLDLSPSYILPQLEEPVEQSKSNIDISSMLLNVSSMQGSFSKPSDDNNDFGIINGQDCHHDLISSVMLSQSDNLQHVNVDDHDFRVNLEDYHDFQSALMGNLNHLLHGGEDDHPLSGGNESVESFPIAGFLPLVLPETWKSSSGSMVWDC